MKKLLLLLFLLGCAENGVGQSANTHYITLKSDLDGLNKAKSVQVAFYIDLADSNNSAGINFRLVSQRVREVTTQINWLAGALFDSLTVGAKLEIVRTVRFDPDLTLGQKQTIIDNVFLNNRSAVLTKWYAEHDNYGRARIIP